MGPIFISCLFNNCDLLVYIRGFYKVLGYGSRFYMKNWIPWCLGGNFDVVILVLNEKLWIFVFNNDRIPDCVMVLMEFRWFDKPLLGGA